MKNERYLNEKILKTCIIFVSLIFLMGFYDDKNIYANLKEITLELGEKLPDNNLDYVMSPFSNADFVLENNVPTNEYGEVNKIGIYDYYIVYRNEERMYSRLTDKKSTISVIDTISPKIKVKDTSLKFNYGTKIKASDVAECFDLSACTLSFESEINTKVSGKHEVIVVATDEGNNISKEIINITIREKVRTRVARSFPSMDKNNNNVNSTLSSEEIEARRLELIAYAKQFAGNPYVYGGNSLTNGTDCSGFTMLVYQHFGYQIPRIATWQGDLGLPVSYNELLPGDLIVYHYDGGGGHVGLFIGNGMMIHAGTEQTGIVIAPIFSGNKVYRRIIY